MTYSANGLVLATGILVFDDRDKVKDHAFTKGDKILIYKRFYACARHQIHYHTEKQEERIFISNYLEFGGDGYGVDNLMASYESLDPDQLDYEALHKLCDKYNDDFFQFY